MKIYSNWNCQWKSYKKLSFSKVHPTGRVTLNDLKSWYYFPALYVNFVYLFLILETEFLQMIKNWKRSILSNACRSFSFVIWVEKNNSRFLNMKTKTMLLKFADSIATLTWLSCFYFYFLAVKISLAGKNCLRITPNTYLQSIIQNAFFIFSKDICYNLSDVNEFATSQTSPILLNSIQTSLHWHA